MYVSLVVYDIYLFVTAKGWSSSSGESLLWRNPYLETSFWIILISMEIIKGNLWKESVCVSDSMILISPEKKSAQPIII